MNHILWIFLILGWNFHFWVAFLIFIFRHENPDFRSTHRIQGSPLLLINYVVCSRPWSTSEHKFSVTTWVFDHPNLSELSSVCGAIYGQYGWMRTYYLLFRYVTLLLYIYPRIYAWYYDWWALCRGVCGVCENVPSVCVRWTRLFRLA